MRWECIFSFLESSAFSLFHGYQASQRIYLTHDAGSKDVMGDLECLEKTLLALLEDRLQGDVDMTVRPGEGATLARAFRGDAFATRRLPRR